MIARVKKDIRWVALGITVGLWACQNAAETAQEPAPPSAPFVRLADAISKAKVQSPLTGINAAESLAELEGSMRQRSVFAEDFERFSFRKVQWPRRPTSTLTSLPEGGRAWAYRGGGSHPYLFVVPIAPSTYYRVRRRVRTSQTKVDIRVLETSLALSQPQSLNHPKDLQRIRTGKFVAVSDLVYIHRFGQAPPGRWTEGGLTFFSSPASRSLVLMLDDAESVVAGRALEVLVDWIRVERLEPSHEQELALLKATHRKHNHPDPHGVVKHGQLLPARNAETVQPPFDRNFDYATALFAPAPTTMTFDITVPPQGRLRFSYAMSQASRPGDEVTFRVQTHARPLWEKTLQLDAQGTTWHWHDAVIDLATMSGKRISLTLQTDAPVGARGYGLWGNPVVESPRPPKGPPNVIVIAVDTLRADRLGINGHSQPTSPHLDALGRDGFNFKHAISASNWTSSAFASIFTGLMPSRHQVIHRARSVPQNLVTLPEHFQRQGWGTHGIVYKAYLYNMGFEQGFDTWFNVPRANVKADDNLQQAITWLRDNHDRQFFLFLHFNDPHQPFNQPAPFDTVFDSENVAKQLGAKLPLLIGRRNSVRGCRKCTRQGRLRPDFPPLAHDLYDGAVRYVDDRIGRFLDALKQHSIYDNSIIAFVADHGELLWEHHNYFGHGGPFLYDELIRVPLMIKPQRGATVGPPRTIETQVRTFDVMPTLLDLAGLPIPEDIQAQSLVPLLADKDGSTDNARLAISENLKQHVISVRHRGWKYVLAHRPGGTSREQLFDLRHDPKEQRSVSQSHPQLLHDLRRQGMSHWVENRPGPFVVVQAAPRSQSYITLRTTGALLDVRSILGAQVTTQGPQEVVFEGSSHGPVTLFAQLTTAQPTDLRIVVRPRRGHKPIVEQTLAATDCRSGTYDDSEMAEGALSIDCWAGYAGGATTREKDSTSFDGDQVATLRALGYIQ